MNVAHFSVRRSPTDGVGQGPPGGSGGGGGGASSSMGNPVHALPWLQLLAAVLETYPDGGCWWPQVKYDEMFRSRSEVV